MSCCRWVVALVLLADPASSFLAPRVRTLRTTPRRGGPDDDGSEQPLLLQAGEAKLSGLLAIACVASNAQSPATDGASVIEAARRLPPGGPLVVAVAVVSGLYTLWKVQPVLRAVQAEVARQDAEMAARRARGE